MQQGTATVGLLAGLALLFAGCNNLSQPKADRVAIAKAEWGQTLLLENPRLIAEKPALLRCTSWLLRGPPGSPNP